MLFVKRKGLAATLWPVFKANSILVVCYPASQLKAQFPDAMKAKGMSPPAKHPLTLGDKRDMLERRREELERWLWRLIATQDVARSVSLKKFLEFDKALQRAQQQR